MAFLGKGKKEDPLDLMRQGKFKQAIKLLEEKLQQNPHEFSLKVRLAEAYEGDKRKEDAAQIYVKEAEVRLAAGELSDAVAMLKRAVRLTPQNDFLVERLAQLDRASRKDDTGQEAFTFDVDTKEGTSEQSLVKPAEAVPPSIQPQKPEVEVLPAKQAPALETPAKEPPSAEQVGTADVPVAATPPAPAAPSFAEPLADPEVREVKVRAEVQEPAEGPAEALKPMPPVPPHEEPTPPVEFRAAGVPFQAQEAPAAPPAETAQAPSAAPPTGPAVATEAKQVAAEPEGGGEEEVIEEAPLEEEPPLLRGTEPEAAVGLSPSAPPAPLQEAPVPSPLPGPPIGEEVQAIESPEFIEEGEPQSQEAVPAALPEESPALLEEIAQVHEDTASLKFVQEAAAQGPPATSQGHAPQVADLTMEAPSALLEETFSNFIALLFPDLSAQHLAAVRGVSKAIPLQPGQVLVREGEEGDSLFILTRGRLEARGTFEGREITLGTFAPGDILGEVAFLNKVPRTATVNALEPSVVIELQGELTRNQLASYPGLLNQLELILQERVLKTLALLKKAEKSPDGNP